jgi:CRISPR-associated endoribonuclease Cas6
MLRLKVSLDKVNSHAISEIPLNYAGMLANQIKGKLQQSFAFNGLYCNSKLYFDKVNVEEVLKHWGKSVDFIISIYDFETTLDQLLEAFQASLFLFPDKYKVVYLKPLEAPDFNRMMNFKTLSPITVSHLDEDTGTEQFVYPGEILFDDLFFERLYQIHLISGGERLDVSTCKYFQNGPYSRKVYGLKTGKGKPKKVGCYFQKFTIVAPKELQRVLFFAGAGKLTDQGFGCVNSY